MKPISISDIKSHHRNINSKHRHTYVDTIMKLQYRHRNSLFCKTQACTTNGGMLTTKAEILNSSMVSLALVCNHKTLEPCLWKQFPTIPYAMRFQFQTSNHLFGMKAKARQTIFRSHFSKSSTYSWIEQHYLYTNFCLCQEQFLMSSHA